MKAFHLHKNHLHCKYKSIQLSIKYKYNKTNRKKNTITSLYTQKKSNFVRRNVLQCEVFTHTCQYESSFTLLNSSLVVVVAVIVVLLLLLLTLDHMATIIIMGPTLICYTLLHYKHFSDISHDMCYKCTYQLFLSLSL